MNVPEGWVRCVDCKDWTPPDDIYEGACSICWDGRIFEANVKASIGAAKERRNEGSKEGPAERVC